MDVLSGIAKDTLLVFVGYSDDASAEVEAVIGLQEKFQAALEIRREVMGQDCPYSRVKIWEWKRDAAGFPMGQTGLIDPIIERADVAIFVFRDRIGDVTWDELERFRNKQTLSPTLTLFPDRPPVERMNDVATAKAWAELVEKREELTQGWRDPDNRPIRRVDDYRDVDHLKTITLTQFERNLPHLLRRGGGEPTQVPAAPSLLGPPEFHRCIPRTEVLDAIDRSVSSSPIVAVEGLSGSGKSSIVSHYLQNGAGKTLYRRIYWFDPEAGACLEDLLTALATEIPLTAQSTHGKCKQLRDYLRQTDAVLVVDDLQSFADLQSGEQLPLPALFKFSSTAGLPARLILLSQLKIPVDMTGSSVERVEVSGFDEHETLSYLADLELDELEPTVLNELVIKTDGLPLAISLFAVLVRSGRYTSDQLLGGRIEVSSRMASWFDDVISMVPAEDRELLNYLALYGAPFPEAIVDAVAAEFTLAAGTEKLERSFLVQRYAVDKWKIHHLIAGYLNDQLDNRDAKRVHRLFAEFHKQIWTDRRSKFLSDDAFVSLEHACKHEQLAGRKRQAELILKAMSPTAKGRGFYEKLKRLGRMHARLFEQRDPWIDYDYAHCCLITGDMRSALDTLNPLLINPLRFKPDLRVQIARLHAEASAALGQSDQGLRRLREVFDSLTFSERKRLRAAVFSQAQSSEIELLTNLGRYDEAESLCRQLIADAHRRNNHRAGAVAMTRWGIIDVKRGDHAAAEERLRNSVDMFAALKDDQGKELDRRGLAWSLSYLSACQAALGDIDIANDNLSTAIRIKAEIEEVSISYRDLIEELLEFPYSAEIKSSLQAEHERVASMLRD